MGNLDRFIKAQENIYIKALNEINNGKKTTHWMWYIFPQLKGLGMSEMANYYGIDNLLEAQEYLNNKLLSSRLYEITNELLNLSEDNPEKIFGYVDAMKLRSCMTLFNLVSSENIFKDVLEKYYGGKVDDKTIALCKNSKIDFKS